MLNYVIVRQEETTQEQKTEKIETKRKHSEIDEDPIPKLEEKKISPQKRTKLANEAFTAKLIEKKKHLQSVEEKEKLRYQLEQQKKQKKKQQLKTNKP